MRAIDMNDGPARVGDGCIGCGLCAASCPAGAITLYEGARLSTSPPESEAEDRSTERSPARRMAKAPPSAIKTVPATRTI